MLRWLQQNPSDRDLEKKIWTRMAAPETPAERNAMTAHQAARDRLDLAKAELAVAQSATVSTATACRALALLGLMTDEAA